MQVKRRLIVAVLTAPLVCATPALGQSLAYPGARSQNALPGSSYAQHFDLASRSPGTTGRRGIGVTSSPFIREDGSAGIRKGVVGRAPLARNLELRLGLLQVTRTTHKERPLQRTQPMKHVEARQDRIAAVGLSLSF